MKLGVIGYGRRIRHMLNEIARLDPEAELTAIADPYAEKKAEWRGHELDSSIWFDTPEEMLQERSLDGVLIGTRCSLHAEMALRVLPSGLPLFMEKPVATNFQDLVRLKEGFEQSRSQVVVSFPLRVTPIVRLAKEIIDSGKIGRVEHVQAVNNVPYGSVYFQNWYRDESETGGLFLQKATHDFDYINYLVGQKPVKISAMTSKQIFKGNKPAGLQCIDCDEKYSCLESAVLKRKKGQISKGEWCAFAEDTGNEDSGSAMIRYESMMHATYSQNFFARNDAQARGARLLGYHGTLEFDFYTNQLKVFLHHTERTETYDVHTGQADHGGGDTILAQNFIDVVKGESSPISTLEQGLLSALMCLKAKESAHTDRFQPIAFD